MLRISVHVLIEVNTGYSYQRLGWTEASWTAREMEDC